MQDIIFPRRLSLSGCRFRSVTAKRRSQLRLLPNVRARVRLSSSRKYTSSTQCSDSIPQWPRTASPNRWPLRYTLRGQDLRVLEGLEVERQQRSDRSLVLPFGPFQALQDRRLEAGEVLVVPAGQDLLLYELPQPLDEVQVRRVRRQVQQLDPQLCGQEPHHLALLVAGVIQH